MKKIYLDHAASTTVYPEILEQMSQHDFLGNPSSGHAWGQANRQLIDEARYGAADIFDASVDEIVFTSGATEAIGLAMVGRYLFEKEEVTDYKILVSPLSHAAVHGAAKFLAQHFGVEVDFLPLDREGLIDLEATEPMLSDYQQVVVEYGNSEVGICHPVARLGKMIRKLREEQQPSPFFLVDGAGAVLSKKISLSHQVCDAVAVSGEKFGGLPGTGCLAISKKFPIAPLVHGSHEFGFRGGTENVVGIFAFGEALKKIESEREILVKKFESFQAHLRTFFGTYFPDIVITTPPDSCVNHIFHFLHPSVDGHLFMQQCDMAGLAVSSGSACSSGSAEGSKVLQRLGYDEASRRGVRLSFGLNTEMEDIDGACEILKQLLG